MAPPGFCTSIRLTMAKALPVQDVAPPRGPFLPLPCSRFAYCHCSDEPGQGCLHFGFF